MEAAEAYPTIPTRPRKRITKACDQCNKSRSKCDGGQPCSHCREIATACSYERVSRRHGRVSKAHPRRSLDPDVVATPGRERSLLQSALNPGDARPGPSLDRQTLGTNHGAMQGGMAHAQTASATPSLWFTNDTSYGDIYGEQTWFNDLWTQSLDGYRINALQPFDQYTPNYSGQSGARPSPRMSDHTATAHAAGSSSSQARPLRYPVLEPLAPYLARMLSPSLACDLLESYVADTAEGVCSPSSPLLLAHIFRRDTLLSSHKPRKCTPALLASMLLVAAHTTEFPFFGGAPTARARLQNGLLRLSLALMDRVPEAGRVPPYLSDAPTAKVAARTAQPPDPAHIASAPPFKRPRTAYIDDIATYMHVALVTMTTESKPPGAHWWHTAFQLAKEHRLNRDPSPPTLPVEPYNMTPNQTPDDMSSRVAPIATEDAENMSGATSPMSVSDDAIVEHSNPRPVIDSWEESEERRRIWWTLYIWDRHLALRYNNPLSIKDAESQDVQLPADDGIWQTSSSPISSPAVAAHGSYRPARGPPPTITGNSIFDVLIPLMCVLGQVIDMHHVAYHPRVERSSSNPVADAYTATITQQLMELEPSITSFESRIETCTASNPVQGHLLVQHHRLLACHARFLLHLFYTLVGLPWDKLILSETVGHYMQSARFTETLNRSLMATDCVNGMFMARPDFGFKAMFFGIFFYHGSTLPWAVAMSLKRDATAEVIGACEVWVRMFEASNTTYQAEYLRKMRKLLLLTLKEIRQSALLSREEQHLRKHIIKLYRWTGDGTGLGL